MAKNKIREAEYAAAVVKYFEILGYEVYKEVGFGGGSMRADVYCKKDRETIAIEVKKVLNLKVIDQAYCWRKYASEVYFAVPAWGSRQLRVVKEICECIGIGMLEVRLGYNNHSEVNVRIPGAVNSEPEMPPLFEEQKDSVAGTHTGDFVTPFKMTCKRLIEHVSTNGEMPLVDVVRSIDHHYANEKSAVAGIQKMVRMGVIKDVELFLDKNRTWVRIKT